MTLFVVLPGVKLGLWNKKKWKSKAGCWGKCDWQEPVKEKVTGTWKNCIMRKFMLCILQ